MPDPESQPARQVLTLIVFSLVMALPIYVAITYFVPIDPMNEPPSSLYTILLAPALLTAVAIPMVERMVLSGRNVRPGASRVQTAAIVSGALSEAPAVFGLLFYFLSGRREWIFFGISAIAFVRLLMRLPEYYRMLEEDR